MALGIAEFSDDVIRLCFDRATESESIRPEVFAVGAKGEIWELRESPPLARGVCAGPFARPVATGVNPT